MPKYLLLFVMTLLISQILAAQDLPTGLVYSDSASLAKRNYLPILSTPHGILPDTVNFADQFPPVSYQGQIGSCSSWACAYGLRSFIEKKKVGANYSFLDGKNELDSTKVFSPLYLFNQIHEAGPNCVTIGSRIEDNLQLMQDEGVCKLGSFHPGTCFDNPHIIYPAAVRQAPAGRIEHFGFLFDANHTYTDGFKLKAIKEYLNYGYPIVIGADIDGIFWKYGGQLVGKTRIWEAYDGNYKGAHAMVVIGYSDSLNAIKIFNSYGTRWGNDGYGWISYTLIDAKVNEAWVVNYDSLKFRTIRGSLSFGAARKMSLDNRNQGVSAIVTGDQMSRFFIRNRFIPVKKIRLMPVAINAAEQNAIIKAYTFNDSTGAIEQVDLFSIDVGQSHDIIYDDDTYNFQLTEIKRYRWWSKEAVFFTLNMMRGHK